MTRYDGLPSGHPLAGVAQASLDSATRALANAVSTGDVQIEPEMIEPLAHAILLEAILADNRQTMIRIAQGRERRSERPHVCDHRCYCPVHHVPLIYSRAADRHACQRVDCVHAHGMEGGRS